MNTTTETRPVRQRKPRPQDGHWVRLEVIPWPGGGGEVDIEAGDAFAQFFDTMPVEEFGRVVPVETSGPPFGVTFSGGRATCECRRFLRTGRCEHAAGLTALVRASGL